MKKDSGLLIDAPGNCLSSHVIPYTVQIFLILDHRLFIYNLAG